MSLYDGQAKRVALLPPAWDSAETPTKEPILIDGVEIGAVLRNVLSQAECEHFIAAGEHACVCVCV